MSPRTKFKRGGPGANIGLSLESNSEDTDTSSSSRDQYDPRPQRVNHSIILSSDDSIVPVGPVSRYLQQKSEEYSTGDNNKPNFEVTMFHGHHGEMMIYPTWPRRSAKW